MSMDFPSGEEILDILFDKDDPLLEDVDCFLGNSINEDLDELKNAVFEHNAGNATEFWKSFLKDIEKDAFHDQIPKFSPENREMDCGSMYSSSLSPQSALSGCDASESNNMRCLDVHDYTAITMPKSSSSCNQLSDHVSSGEAISTSIDIGADVVVVTSDCGSYEDSIHSGNDTSESESVEPPKKKKAALSYSKRLENESFCYQSVTGILKLSEEEKKLIAKEGLHIPTDLPLTKAEERELKRIRRKIRNKHSAQESRKRKKEYVDGLENRVKLCTSENLRLQKKVQTLEKDQKGLLEQIKHLQAIISNSSGKSVQTNTCFLVVFLSLALILFPSLVPNSMQSKQLLPGQKQPVNGRSRVLLSAQDGSESTPIRGKIMEENISSSVIKHIPEIKPEQYMEQAYSKVFEGFDDIPRIKVEKTVPEDYIFEPIDLGPSKARASLPNSSSYESINPPKKARRDVLLFNK